MPFEPHFGAFPADPPADPDDPTIVAAHDWTAFKQIKEITDHWERPGWEPGTRANHWLLTMPTTACCARPAASSPSCSPGRTNSRRNCGSRTTRRPRPRCPHGRAADRARGQEQSERWAKGRPGQLVHSNR